MENHEEKSINKGFVEGLLWSIDRLVKPLLKPFSRNSNPISIYEEDLEPLQRMLARIKATLKDSDNLAIRQRGRGRGEFLKLWVTELQALECSAEDIIEELEFQAFRKEKVAEFKTHLRLKYICHFLTLLHFYLFLVNSSSLLMTETKLSFWGL